MPSPKRQERQQQEQGRLRRKKETGELRVAFSSLWFELAGWYLFKLTPNSGDAKVFVATNENSVTSATIFRHCKKSCTLPRISVYLECMQNFINKIQALDAAMNFTHICTDPVLEIVVSESNVLKPANCKTREEILAAIKNAETFWIRVSKACDSERSAIFVYTV